MNYRALLVVVGIAAAAVPAAYAEDRLAVGIVVGEPTGVTVKKWLNSRVAINTAAAWSFSDNDSFQFHADYLIHDYTITRHPRLGGKMPVYYGVGARVKLEEEDNNNIGRNNDDTLIGVRIPVGVTYLLPDRPLDIFAEFVPILDIAPDTELDLNAAIGVRYYFD